MSYKSKQREYKYKSLCVEIQRMWNIKCMIMPVVVTGATGIVTKGLKKNSKAIAGKSSVDSLKKTVVLETSHITLKVLQSETGSPSSEDDRCFKRRTASEETDDDGDDTNNRDHEKGPRMVIDVAISGDRNVIKKKLSSL